MPTAEARSRMREAVKAIGRMKRSEIRGGCVAYENPDFAALDPGSTRPFAPVGASGPFAIDAIVVLPDHLHAIFTLPPDDADFSGRWRRIKGHFSSSMIAQGLPAARHVNGRYVLWQRRFWEHTIRDEDDFARHVDYIHFNPVKHGLVSRVRDWPHSSFHRYVHQGFLPADWAGDVRQMGTRHGERAE